MSSSLAHATSSTSNKCPVLEVKPQDSHTAMAKLEYSHNLPIKKEMSSRSLHHCDYCPYGSKSIFFVLNHVRRHRLPWQLFDCATSNVELYHCKNCGINFDSIVHFQNHIKGTHSMNEKIDTLKSFICTTCSFATSSALQSLEHIRTGCLKMGVISNASDRKMVRNKTKRKDPTKIHKCDKCEYKTIWKHNFIRHQTAKHSNDSDSKWFHCEKCPHKSVLKSNLIRHIMTIHADDKKKTWFSCEKCMYKAVWKYQLDSHVLNNHTDDKDRKWFQCDKCVFKSTRKAGLKDHIFLKHTDDIEKGYQCEKCTYKARCEYNLNKHVRMKHSDDEDIKWFHCKMCTYKATLRGTVDRHIVTKHTDDEDKKRVSMWKVPIQNSA